MEQDDTDTQFSFPDDTLDADNANDKSGPSCSVGRANFCPAFRAFRVSIALENLEAWRARTAAARF